MLQPGAASLVRGHWAVDEIIEFDRSRGWRAYPADPPRRSRTRHFDVVLALQVYFKAGLVTSFTHAPVKLGFDRARARDLNWLFTTDRIPAARGAARAGPVLRVPRGAAASRTSRSMWDLGPWEHERAWQREFLARFDRPIAPIVVGTSKPEKDWMPERWADGVRRALHGDFGLQPVLVGGRSARELEAERVILERASVPVTSALGSGPAQPRRHPRRRGARALARHRARCT